MRAVLDAGVAARVVALLRSEDPGDGYLLALAARERAPLVTGDAHLLALADRVPVFSPREFLDKL